jgi:enamine deaminase RidA (YjgF/YER057c/UK114 family)
MICEDAAGRGSHRSEEIITMKGLAMLVASAAALGSATASAHDIIRHAQPNIPVATSVLVPAGVDLIFVSGMLPDVADPAAPMGSVERLGDTATQAKSVLGKIARELEGFGLTMADIVRMNVFLVGDPRNHGEIDLQGLMQAYIGLYGMRALEKNLPARTTVQVAGLPAAGALVEIEVIAARHPPE